MTERELSNAMTDYGDTVYRLALCRLQNVEDAEDVYQDVFLNFFRQGVTGWDSEHTKAWLIRAALNRCADLGRQRGRTLPLEAAAEPIHTADEAAAELWDTVARLPEELRVPVHLYYGEGYDSNETAALFGIPAATVRGRLRRARMQLKNLLGGFDDESEQPEPLSETGGIHPYARRAE